ncbi:MAG: M48 family metallopeptidase [Rubrivivax sp.]|nr:MAG: M48 family metallopeptidase [Rubrivivax sp.]
MSHAALPGLQVDYFDGLHARPRRLEARVESGQLRLSEPGMPHTMVVSLPTRDVQWPERTRHGARIAQLPDGGAVHGLNGADWDEWVRLSGAHAESWTVKWQQSWRWTVAAAIALVLCSLAAYRWGLPWATTGVLAVTPASIDRELGQATLRSMEGRWLQPSRLPMAEQQRLRSLLERALRTSAAQGSSPADVIGRAPHRLHFRRATIGPNAFALPDGSLVLTDELVALLKEHDDVLIGVLAHEVGHVRHRHGMRLFVQSGILGAAVSVAWGDFSSLIAAAPALLGQMAYSRDFEREADDDAITVLRANGIRPSVMVTLFEQLQAHRRGQNAREVGPADDGESGSEDVGIAFGSHPPDAERIQRFHDADHHLPLH